MSFNYLLVLCPYVSLGRPSLSFLSCKIGVTSLTSKGCQLKLLPVMWHKSSLWLWSSSLSWHFSSLPKFFFWFNKGTRILHLDFFFHSSFLPFVRTFKFYSLCKFQFYNTVLSIKITMFYIRSSDLFHL